MHSFLLGYRRLRASLGLASSEFCRLIRKPDLPRLYSMLMFPIILALSRDTCSLSASFLFRAISEAPVLSQLVLAAQCCSPQPVSSPCAACFLLGAY